MKKPIFPMSSKDWTDYDVATGKVSCKLLWDKRYLWELKYDWARYILQRGSETWTAYLTSRGISKKTGKHVDKTENLIGYLFDNSKDMAGTVLDGEVVALDENGNPINWNGSNIVTKIMWAKPEKAKHRLENEGFSIGYVAYDILYYKGQNLQEMPLKLRKTHLEQALIDMDNTFSFKFSKRIILSQIVMWPEQWYLDSVLEAGFEGLMLKHINGKYQQDKRSSDWVKIKKLITEDGVILWGKAWTGKYKDTLGSLIIGQFVWRELKEVCTIWGMTDEQRRDFWNYLEELYKEGDAGKDTKGNIYIDIDTIAKEGKVVEFIAQEKTAKKYRHPRFIKIRDDKPIKDCVFYSELE